MLVYQLPGHAIFFWVSSLSNKSLNLFCSHSFEWFCLQISHDAKHFFVSCPRHCDRVLIVVIVYYFQIWNKKKHNIIISRLISSHMGPMFFETLCTYILISSTLYIYIYMCVCVLKHDMQGKAYCKKSKHKYQIKSIERSLIRDVSKVFKFKVASTLLLNWGRLEDFFWKSMKGQLNLEAIYLFYLSILDDL